MGQEFIAPRRTIAMTIEGRRAARQTPRPKRPARRCPAMPDVKPAAIAAEAAASRKGITIYPAPYAALVAGRDRKALGEVFGLSNFGVNLTRLPPGARSALRHVHSRQDEFIYILEGQPVLVLD